MSRCIDCGAEFGCAMVDGAAEPCWCTELPARVALPQPGAVAGCWCRACLELHLAEQPAPAPGA
jgi:hypothetical protein